MAGERTSARRVSRRWFLGAGGALAGAAGLGAIRCSGGSGNRLPTAGQTPVPTRERPTPTPRAAGEGPHEGGRLRYTGFVTGDGQFDPHMTQAGPVYGHQAAVFSRLLAYEDQADARIVPDLAAAMPEQPDSTTYIFRLNRAARWHEREPLNGRAVTPEDVKFSIERQRDGAASLFPRKPQWLNVESVAAPGDGTVIVKSASPLAAMLHFFADVNGFIVPPELAGEGRRLDVEHQVGSGPFQWVEWNEGEFASLAANRAWHGQPGPYVEGVTLLQPRDSADIEARLRTKQIDVATVGRPQADRLKAAIPALREATFGQSLFWGMRFFTVNPPWNDQRVRTAISMAVDRRQMLQSFFSGEGEMNPWVSWPIKRWSLPQGELQALPGYRAGPAGRDQDLREARALIDAYKGEGNSIPDLGLVVLDQAEARLRMGTLIRDQLQKDLGIRVIVYPVELPRIIHGLLHGEFPWVAGPDNGWIDLDDWVYPYFHSAGTKNTFPLRDPEMDALINAQRAELNEAERRRIGFDIQRRLLGLNVAVNFVSERVVSISWPYVRDFPLDASDGYQHRLARVWIDRAHDTYRGVR
jgi:peptide/nickel transport system substrate-binding protein